MDQPDARRKRRNGLSVKFAAAACAGAAAVTFMLPGTTAFAEPDPLPPATDTPAPAPADPNATPALVDPAAPVDPTVAPEPADPAATPAPVEPGRITDEAGGLTFVLPAGFERSDTSQLTYGSSLLTKPDVADTSILIGKLDLKLFAGAEPDNTKAAQRLASDMGEFFMPYPGTRINQETVALNAGGVPGAASYYEVDFTDTTKPNGQIWAAAIGNTLPDGAANAGANQERWFVVWLGTANSPVDKAAAQALAESILPWYPPPPPVVDPNAPAPAVDPNAPVEPAPVGSPVGVPVPVATPVPEMGSPPA
ncbi:MAG: APA family fibronectin-binding glycoprotein [Mycobacterium sp.]